MPTTRYRYRGTKIPTLWPIAGLKGQILKEPNRGLWSARCPERARRVRGGLGETARLKGRDRAPGRLHGLELTDPGFDPSLLSKFRARLVDHGVEERVFTRC